jgi:hypothetical protein
MNTGTGMEVPTHSKQFKICMPVEVVTGMAFLFWIYLAGSYLFFMMLVA